MPISDYYDGLDVSNFEVKVLYNTSKKRGGVHENNTKIRGSDYQIQ